MVLDLQNGVGMSFISKRETTGRLNQKDGIWIVDAEGRTTYANDRMCEILGVSPAEILGQHSFEYVFPEDVSTAQRLFESKERGDANPFHFRLRRKDGSAVWVNVQGTPMLDGVGSFNGIVGTFAVAPPNRGWAILGQVSAVDRGQ